MYSSINKYFGGKGASVSNVSGVTSLMGTRGEDIRDLPQLLSPENAEKVSNFVIVTDGRLEMRKGLENLFTDGTAAFDDIEKYTDDLYFYGTSTTLKVYSKSADSSETINTYSVAGKMQIERYGDYAFVTNGTEPIGRVSRTLGYDAQSANFTAGAKLTGGTSGATGIILEDDDSGTSGTLTLGNITGTFEDNETITDDNSSPGSATSDGTLAWTYTEVSGAPTCSILRVAGSRLYAGRLKTDPAAVAYSNADTGGNPPFNDWTVDSDANDPGQLNFRNAGSVNAIESLGPNIIVFADNGKWSFYINVIDSAGTLKKVDVITIARVDQGGFASVNTPKGLFYINNAGLWQLISVGQANVPFSDQEDLASRLLGSSYFNNIDLSNASMEYDQKQELVLTTCANDSSANNYIIPYSTVYQSFTRYVGWNISAFLNDEGTLYGAGSATGKVWELFKGYDDDGADIWTEYVQELKTGDLETRQELQGIYVQGFLSPSTEVALKFDIYDRNGVLVNNKLEYEWTAQSGNPTIDGYGTASWGSSAFGGDVDTGNMVESFDGGRMKIANYQRIRIHITSHGQVPYAVNWVKLLARVKRPIRRRKLNLVT